MEENVRYRVNGDRIEPIDNENIGVIQHNTNLSYGLQQFLQLKYDCTLTSVNTITSYLSNFDYYKKIKNYFINLNLKKCLFQLKKMHSIFC